MKHAKEPSSSGVEVCEYAVAFPKCLRPTHRAPRSEITPPPRVPRLARLMALAIRFDRLIADGVVRDYADIARLGHVTRARLTQIMSLLFLAPDIQEAILFLPVIPVDGGADSLTERDVRSILTITDWTQQRRWWKALVRREHHT